MSSERAGTMDRRDGSDCGYGGELEEIDRPSRRLTEEPLNRDNAFIIAALSFILRAGGGPLSLLLRFFGRKGSIVVEL